MADEENSLHEVCQFLKQRNISDVVVNEFKKNKMDKEAVLKCEDEDLRSLGLKEKGHMICLRAFCTPQEELQNAKKTLASYVKEAGKQRVLKTTRDEKSVTLCWKHFDVKRSQYISVRTSRGGGNRQLTLHNEANYNDIVTAMTDLFFPDGNSTFGSLKQMNVKIGSFKGDFIEQPFCLKDYIHQNKLCKTRLYLMTKKISNNCLVRKMKPIPSSFNISDDDDFNLPDVKPIVTKQSTLVNDPQPVSWSSTSNVDDIDTFSNSLFSTSAVGVDVDIMNDKIAFMLRIGNMKGKFDKPKAAPAEIAFMLESNGRPKLIGTSQERSILAHEVSGAYNASLKTDREKAVNRVREQDNQKRLIELMNSRRERVLPEPSLSEPHVVISVRNPCTCKTEVRLFKENSYFTEVYDWIGSLSPVEFFNIVDYTTIITPDRKVYSAVFNMEETNAPLPMTPEGTVAFTGYKLASQNLVHEIGEFSNIPSVEDCSEDYTSHCYNLLQQERIQEYEKLKPLIYATVSRENIYHDMINLYKKRNTANHQLQLSFDNEEASGDGVTRDAFSAFFASVYSKMDGSNERVPRTIVDDDDLVAVGKAITHAFIMCNIFPFEICKSSIKHCIFGGDINKTELLTSFMAFIMPKEASIIQRFRSGILNEDEDAIMDILTEYSVFTKPTHSNVDTLLEKAAKVALIKGPHFSLQSLVRGMGKFWEKLDVSLFDALYGVIIPTSEKIIASLTCHETSNHDAKIVTWLHRYIRNLSKTSLSTFVQFITGSGNLLPDTSIKVEFINQPLDHARPTSKTCFKILYVPRQYSSLSELKQNFDFYILNNLQNWCVHD